MTEPKQPHQTAPENPSESQPDAFTGQCVRCGAPQPHVCLRDIDQIHDHCYGGDE